LHEKLVPDMHLGSIGDARPFPFDQKIVWTPDEDAIADSNLQRFLTKLGIDSLDELHSRAAEDVGWFWAAVLDDLRIEFREPWSQIVDLSEGPAFPRWCVDARMNIIDNALDRWLRDPASASRTALRAEREDGEVHTLSYARLNDEVCRCANALTELGFRQGDVAGLFMPMTVELICAFLAVIKLGGVVLPLFSGYGPDAVATRLQDANARFLFVADAFYRRGKVVAMKPVADEALGTSRVEHVVVLRNTGSGTTTRMQDGRDVWWHEMVPRQEPIAATVDTGAEDPLMIIYTSGTTGRPKGAVHTHCGFPIKGAQDMFHCMDVKPDDAMYWMSDMGWMMGPWLVFGTLVIGATMVIYDGAPDYPSHDRTWALVERHGVTHLGLSPVLVRSLMPHGKDSIALHDLSSLRAACSTGSPWDPDSWLWLFNNVLGARKPILNYSGGTEISGGILCGNLFEPLKPCSFSGPVPGMAADVVDEHGKSLRGAVGELIIRQPWIGMTRGFLNDRERYLDSYWRKFEGVWVHGDFAVIDDDGLWFVLGRSDDTIKVAGKRVGPAEVEAVVNRIPRVQESAAIGVPDALKGESLVVFCVLVASGSGDDHLRTEVASLVASALGKPLRPKGVYFTRSLPKTRNAKVMRRIIRAAHLDLDLGNLTGLEDVTSIEDIRNAE
jgi:acetyl-CoA synthetase